MKRLPTPFGVAQIMAENILTVPKEVAKYIYLGVVQ